VYGGSEAGSNNGEVAATGNVATDLWYLQLQAGWLLGLRTRVCHASSAAEASNSIAYIGEAEGARDDAEGANDS
jgi:hypothetical protein